MLRRGENFFIFLKNDAANTRQITLKLNRTTDADIIRRLEEIGNKQGYIKELIRRDMAE